MASETPRVVRSRLTPIVLMAGLALLFVVGLVFWASKEAVLSDELPAIPSPNGYDDVLAGARVVEKRIAVFNRVDISTADEATLKAIVEAARDGVKRALPGLDLPFQIPVILDLNEQMRISIKDASSIRGGLARALFAEGRLSLLEPKTNPATRADVDLVRLGDAMSHHAPMQIYLMGIATEAMGLRLLRDAHAKLDAPECRRLIEILEKLESKRQPASGAIDLEQRVMDYNLQKMNLFARTSMRMSGVLAKEKTRMASTLESSQRRRDATHRLLILALALRAYRLEHPEYPESLDTLVPAYLKSVPIDPYTEKPLIYRRDAKEAQFYSTGPDRDDDKLDPPLGRRHVDTSNGDFTINSF